MTLKLPGQRHRPLSLPYPSWIPCCGQLLSHVERRLVLQRERRGVASGSFASETALKLGNPSHPSWVQPCPTRIRPATPSATGASQCSQMFPMPASSYNAVVVIRATTQLSRVCYLLLPSSSPAQHVRLWLHPPHSYTSDPCL